MHITTFKTALLYLAFILLVGCGGDTQTNPATEHQATATVTDTASNISARYNRSCISCHAYGSAGAPRSHDVAAWKTRLAKGMATLITNTQQGINAMPAKGMCMDCSDAEFEALILFMASEK